LRWPTGQRETGKSNPGWKREGTSTGLKIFRKTAIEHPSEDIAKFANGNKGYQGSTRFTGYQMTL
jgi:hypothetical protein